MSVYADFQLHTNSNGTLQIQMTPPATVAGWSVQLDVMYRFNSPQPIFSLYGASGYYTGQSGITLVDPVNGIWQATLTPAQMSGLPNGNYAYLFHRTDSGVSTIINEGYRIVGPF